MRRTVTLVASAWGAGFVAGVATLYFLGPPVGLRMMGVGAHLVALSGDVGLLTAEESRQVVTAIADSVVSEKAQRLLPATVVRR